MFICVLFSILCFLIQKSNKPQYKAILSKTWLKKAKWKCNKMCMSAMFFMHFIHVTHQTHCMVAVWILARQCLLSSLGSFVWWSHLGNGVEGCRKKMVCGIESMRPDNKGSFDSCFLLLFSLDKLTFLSVATNRYSLTWIAYSHILPLMRNKNTFSSSPEGVVW